MIILNIALKSLFNTDNLVKNNQRYQTCREEEKVLVGIGIFPGKVIRVI